ncbi:MAG: PTS sugar transporter subunit IIA [Deltaproteobacteria bacterium]|nr:PTS sugar transporter subunit IIA [Deltaproteobacteria bacterium]
MHDRFGPRRARGLSSEFLRTTGMILGKEPEGVVGIAINAMDDPQEVAEQIQGAVKKGRPGDGVIILTDMFGGTPSNVALSFLQDGRVEVISGMNLPMILKAVEVRDGLDLTDIAGALKQSGRDNISLASDILKGNGN